MDTPGAVKDPSAELNPMAMTPASPSPDSCDGGSALPSAGAVWPRGATARIQKAGRPVTTSGRARAKGWRLTFARRSPPVLEPLMGWTGGDDPLAQVELSFPTLEAAIRYAKGQGLGYEVIPPPGAPDGEREPMAEAARIFSDATLQRLGLSRLQDRHGHAPKGSAGRDAWDDPMEVATDPALSPEARRSVPMNWAWHEYLTGQATSEGMPENDRPSRLAEVEQALRALECRASTPAGTPREITLAARAEAMEALIVSDADRGGPSPSGLPWLPPLGPALRDGGLSPGSMPRSRQDPIPP